MSNSQVNPSTHLLSTASLLGQLLSDRYLIERLLGQGGMGSVYLAQDIRLGTQVVVKVPRVDLLDNPGLRARFAIEMRALCRLSHAHIVRVVDAGEHAGLPFMVLPFLEGGNLSERSRQISATRGIAANRYLMSDLERWILPVAQALDALHRDGLVHRDIKPGNILFDRHGQVYINDFGIAKILYEQSQPQMEQTQRGDVPGTPEYMAPELLLGHSYDGRVDQYALAIVVYETLTGVCPFGGGSPANKIVQQITVQPPMLHEIAAWIPLGVSMSVLQAMSKNPQERFGSSEEFARKVLRFLDANSIPPVSRMPAYTTSPVLVTPVFHPSRETEQNVEYLLPTPSNSPPPLASQENPTFADSQIRRWGSWILATMLPYPLTWFVVCSLFPGSSIQRLLFTLALSITAVSWLTRSNRLMCGVAVIWAVVWFALLNWKGA